MKNHLLQKRTLTLGALLVSAPSDICSRRTLGEGDAPRRLLVVDGDIRLADAGLDKETWVTITREGRFYDPRYDEFDISSSMLDNMVKNFNENVYGQKIFIDVAHRPGDGAAGEVIKLSHERRKLRALVRWNPLGVDAVNNKGYRYFSIDYADNYQDNEARAYHGATMFGAALCTRPVIKGLDALDRIQLAEADGNVPTFLHPNLADKLRLELQENKVKFAQYIATLKSALEAKKINAKLLSAIIDEVTKSMETITEEAQAKALCTMAEAAAIKLNEQANANAPGPITLSFTAPTNGLTEAGVIALMESRDAAAATAARTLAERTTTNRTSFATLINAVATIPQEVRTRVLADCSDLITAEMSADQIKRLAENQLAHISAASIATQLAQRGFQPGGNVTFVSDQSTKKLGEIYRDQLKKTGPFAEGRLTCTDKPSPFVEKVLALFDHQNAQALHNESKALAEGNGVRMLAAGAVVISDTNLPVGFQRQTILEALSDLRILDLVTADTDPTATVTTQIPYELRDVASVYNDGVVFEGQPIHRAGVSQAMDIGYIQPMKLAMLISNEVAHFTRTSGIDWDAVGRNIASNARLMRELISRRIANELQRSSDAFAATAVVAEAFDAQVTGANSVIKTVNYPLIRPYQPKDLQGTNVGAAENLITMTLNGVVITEYDGTGLQGAGTYYRVTNYNLGYIQLVNQLGVAQTPADLGVNTISYKYSTNVVKVDLDLGALTTGAARDKIIRAIGARKAILSGQRFVEPDFLLMSPVLHDETTNADMFAASLKRDGTATSAMGDLERIKSVPAWGTNQPGINLGDERILIGQKGLLTYKIAKPYVLGEPFEAVDANGKAIGKKQSYGEEYSAIKLPTPLRGRMTSVLAYGFAGR